MEDGMSLEEERAMLADILENVDEIVEAAEAVFDGADPGLVAWADQLDAAGAETTSTFEEMKTLPDRFHGPADSGWLAPRLLAGTLRCSANAACQHAREGTRPVYAFFGARVMACRECLPAFYDVVRWADMEVRAGSERGTICDLCLQPSPGGFRKINVAFGPALVTADICTVCFDAVEADDKDGKGGGVS